jgi:hypothetical protein
VSNNRILHFEIPANQPEALTKSCNASSAGGSRRRRFQISNTGCAKLNPINGAVMKRQAAGQPGMNYVDESSIDATLEQRARFRSLNHQRSTPWRSRKNPTAAARFKLKS